MTDEEVLELMRKGLERMSKRDEEKPLVLYVTESEYVSMVDAEKKLQAFQNRRKIRWGRHK